MQIKSNGLAISAEKLGKYYRIGVKEQLQDSMGATIIEFIKSPLRNYRKYRSLYKFSNSELEIDTTNIIWALRDLSFQINSGEKIGIIGKNGAGKSTLLKILSKITSPSSGQAQIYGRVSSLLEVGTGFHPELSGRENVYLNGTILGMRKKEIDQKFEEIVDFSGVKKFLDTPVKRYSSGMRVRLAFAVAAHLEPEIMIVDEVLAVGDAAFQQKCLAKMEDVGKSGRTVLFVSHNMGAIVQLCDRALWLDDGQLKLDGPANTVVASYLTEGSQGHSTWNRASKELGKTNVIIYCARLLNSSDRTPSISMNFGDPLDLEIAYEVVNKSKNISVFFRVTDTQGNVILISRDTDITDWKGRTREVGKYISLCKMPYFLKPGRYHLTVGVNEGPKLSDRFENILTFDVLEIGCTINPNRVGIVMPLLNWEVNVQNEKIIKSIATGK